MRKKVTLQTTPNILSSDDMMEMRGRIIADQGTPADARRLFVSHETWRRRAIFTQSALDSYANDSALDGLTDTELERFSQMSVGTMFVNLLDTEQVLEAVEKRRIDLRVLVMEHMSKPLPKPLSDDPEVAKWVMDLLQAIHHE